MKKFYLFASLFLASCLTKAQSVYTDGYFIVNEEWFGHTNGSVNFINTNGSVNYRV